MKDPGLNPSELTTNRKAFLINLDPEIYGTFAEIGAGQEVARHFFQAGGAAGTVAKSMSAYDMKFSDEIYGKAERYVSRGRLLQMLDHEYGLLTERLAEQRGESSCFFAFADTVAAAGYKTKKECHGWLGIRFQLRPGAPANDILFHVRMVDNTNTAQQEALGIVGVNLMYGAMVYNQDPQKFVEGLLDRLSTERIEIGMLEFNGPDFDHIDNRVLSLRLVQAGLTNAVLFGPNKSVLQPSAALRKKAVLVERGSFRPITHVNIDMLRASGAMFVQEEAVQGEEVVALLEITINNLLTSGNIDYEDFLSRVDVISTLGYSVLISNYMEYYRLSAYFRRYTDKMIGLVLGINHLLAIFNEEYYAHLDGGVLEAFGRLFKHNVRLYVYPMRGEGYASYVKASPGTEQPEVHHHDAFSSDMIITADNVMVAPHLRHLYQHLRENHSIERVAGVDIEHLTIFSRDVLSRIQSGDLSWEDDVPPPVAETIKKHGYWGYKPPEGATLTQEAHQGAKLR